MIQINGKQNVFQQLHGWIRFGAASPAPHILDHDPLGGGLYGKVTNDLQNIGNIANLQKKWFFF